MLFSIWTQKDKVEFSKGQSELLPASSLHIECPLISKLHVWNIFVWIKQISNL